MKIKQFEYKPLSHFSYAIISDGKMALVDPERNPLQYYKYAEENDAQIVAVFETHPHADFVSSHLQIHKETGAKIYCSKKTGADYPNASFDDGDEVSMGNTIFRAINTPGHSPDSITILANEENKTALFTGDTLFVGDVGRPDLREKAGHMKAKREELAKMMYETIQNKFTDLPDTAYVYPAHGAGSLCGKGMSEDASSSTLGNERVGNWAFKKQTEEQFVNHLLDSQPFIPHYFGYNVGINKNGAKNLRSSLGGIEYKLDIKEVNKGALIIDIRDESEFKKNHLPGSINVMATSETSKFETWLGSIVRPDEKFHLVVDSIENAEGVLQRTAKIGYETNVESVFTLDDKDLEKSMGFNLEDFKNNTENYTIVDIRNESEVADGKFFKSAITIPLHQLREKANEIPTNKPIVVHCAGGYRSAAGASILERELNVKKVFDLSDDVENFK
ncbi:rhodanese-like domain-containing protein [Aequorivita sp. CIP111184]|uniref:MBL fold metallo-hydrolase n=1 Tax=Aequorivita sp. CIP111184 TaxID=2211356 RepID=UPI000DBC006F|nr:rhodanese-like domain-containing protein [Aequorivita sp. CIP111184]SRX55189.1 putative polyketide biosynthesis zinc-dependent hydrolase PksB [Aequorivita sp. CIP111184]